MKNFSKYILELNVNVEWLTKPERTFPVIIDPTITNKGQEIKQVGDYVSEGDILISGEIKFNEETKNIVCASGDVYAEVWYTTEVKLPLNYTEEKYT